MINSHSSLFLKLVAHRFAKFALVGVSGVPVNVFVLYLGKEYLFSYVSGYVFGFDLRLNLALVFAIFCSIANNFVWNRHCTWGDRKHARRRQGYRLLRQFGRYVVASWLGVAIQLTLTNILTQSGLYYLIANLLAIGVASIANFLLSDRWAFSTK